MRKVRCLVCTEWFEYSGNTICSEECSVSFKNQQSKRNEIVSAVEVREDNYKRLKNEAKAAKLQARKQKKIERLNSLQEQNPNMSRAELIKLLKRSKRSVHIQAKDKKIRALKRQLQAFKSGNKPVKKERGFYDTKAWKALRYEVLKTYGRKCMNCGKSKDTVIHVDHIKPRSLFPHLELDFNNLQVLCQDCNEGKSNKDDTDFRQLK